MLVGLLCGVLLLPTSFSFAQNPTPLICSAPSSTMLLYQEFQNKMIVALAGSSGKEKVFTSNASAW